MQIRQKTTWINFNLTTGFGIEKYSIISIKFKIRISQLVAKINLKQRSLN